MLEKVVEGWLTETNERGLEVPFAQLLAGEGHDVVHLSRHGPLEQGKDLITIDPQGTPCAFQLKAPGVRLTLRQWEQIVPQVIRLVELPIVHPSIDGELPRKPFLVVNGELEEEVREEITRRNEEWARRGYPTLSTIVRGQLQSRFLALHAPFFPTNLATHRDLLELYLADGAANLNKRSLFRFLRSVLPAPSPPPTPLQASRALSSAAVLTAYAASQHQLSSNHVATLEAWLTYLGVLSSMVEELDLPEQHYAQPLELCLSAATASLDSLVHELKTRTTLVEGNALVDTPFYRPRVTWLMGLVAARSLIPLLSREAESNDDFLLRFCFTNIPRLILWGEAAIPQFLALAWLLESAGHADAETSILTRVLRTIIAANSGSNPAGLPDPHHDIVEVLRRTLGIDQDQPWEAFAGRSFALKAIVHLLARRGWRAQLAASWPSLTRVSLAEFTPSFSKDFPLPASEQGTTEVSFPNTPQSWSDLVQEASVIDQGVIPRVLAARPAWLLLFIIAFPHRLTSSVARFLDHHITISFPSRPAGPVQ